MRGGRHELPRLRDGRTRGGRLSSTLVVCVSGMLLLKLDDAASVVFTVYVFTQKSSPRRRLLVTLFNTVLLLVESIHRVLFGGQRYSLARDNGFTIDLHRPTIFLLLGSVEIPPTMFKQPAQYTLQSEREGGKGEESKMNKCKCVSNK